jgi:hypothetical protein
VDRVIAGEIGVQVTASKPRAYYQRVARRANVVRDALELNPDLGSSALNDLYFPEVGRKPMIPKQVLHDLKKKATTASIAGAGVTNVPNQSRSKTALGAGGQKPKGSFSALTHQAREKYVLNNYPSGNAPDHLTKDFGITTEQKALKGADVQRRGADNSTKRRLEARNDQYNTISMLVALMILYNLIPGIDLGADVLHPELVFCHDKTSLLLNGEGEVEIVTTAEAIEEAKKQKTSLNALPDPDQSNQKRTLGLTNITSASGAFHGSVAMIKDSRFGPLQIHLLSLESKLWLATYNTKVDEFELANALLFTIIFPIIEKIRDERKRQSSSDPIYPAVPPASPATDITSTSLATASSSSTSTSPATASNSTQTPQPSANNSNHLSLPQEPLATALLTSLASTIESAEKDCPKLLTLQSPFEDTENFNPPHDALNLKFTGDNKAIINESLNEKAAYSSKVKGRLRKVKSAYFKLLKLVDNTSTESFQKPNFERLQGGSEEVERAALAFDGELFQLRAFTEGKGAQYTACNNIDGLKVAAGDTATGQPNDQMSSHRTIKQFMRSPAFKHMSLDNVPRPSWQSKLNDILKPLPPGHAEVYSKAIRCLPLILSSAYTVTEVLRGWECMDYKHPEAILGACPTYKKLSADEKKLILDSIPELALEAVRGVGTASDALMARKFSEFLGAASVSVEDEDDENGPSSSSSSSSDPTQTRSTFEAAQKDANKKRRRPPTDYVLNRWRATILTSPAARWSAKHRLLIKECQEAYQQLREVGKTALAALKEYKSTLKPKASGAKPAKKGSGSGGEVAAPSLDEAPPACVGFFMHSKKTSAGQKTLISCPVRGCNTLHFCEECVEKGVLSQHLETQHPTYKAKK